MVGAHPRIDMSSDQTFFKTRAVAAHNEFERLELEKRVQLNRSHMTGSNQTVWQHVWAKFFTAFALY